MWDKADLACVHTVQALCMDQVQRAQSGHPGAPMALSPLAHVLFSRHLRQTSEHPNWLSRDRFVLSNGHACALHYSLLHLTGYLSLEDLRSFRQLHSRTPGHPESSTTPGVEVTTGPLGQGMGNAVGLALAERHLAAVFNRPQFPVFDNFMFVVCGDGCMMEGVTSEAMSLAGHLRLSKLIVFYDSNRITIDGSTDLAFTEDVAKRFEAYGFAVISDVSLDPDLQTLDAIVSRAKADPTGRPKLVIVPTTIGLHSRVAGTCKAHGAALGADEVARVKSILGLDPQQSFHVPGEVQGLYDKVRARNVQHHRAWERMLQSYGECHPDLHAQLQAFLSKHWTTEELLERLPKYNDNNEALATRKCSELCLNVIADTVPNLIGGSADLAESTLVAWKHGCQDFQAATPQGRFLRYGIREHAMFAVNNGIAAYGAGLWPFASTFLNFITYGWPAVRLGAMSNLRTLYVMTHDSIGLGEDGPTHQPIECLALLRATPNIDVYRPADGRETVGAYACIFGDRSANRSRPTVLCLSRQKLPQLTGSSVQGVKHGAYVLKAAAHLPLKAVIVATGSEVHIALEALSPCSLSDPLAESSSSAGTEDLLAHVQLVSMPSWTLFEEQPEEYRQSIFPAGVPVLSVEAGSTFGWSKFADASIGVDSFGASGPEKLVYEHFHLTAKHVREQILKLMSPTG